MTALYDQIIFGPVRSRRLGLSLGVNLLPVDNKICSFECIYCECGWSRPEGRMRFNARDDVRRELEARLNGMVAAGTPPDAVTFAGNGEPTLHPHFEAIIDDALALRERLCPSARISVLSNATAIDREDVRRALLRVDNNILKLDSAIDATVQLIDNPHSSYSVAETVRLMKLFGGRLVIQTMFLRGECRGMWVDNTTEEEIETWLGALREVKPQRVMIYAIDRDTPLDTLQKVPLDQLEAIARRVRDEGMECSTAG
ncbi:MAG: radical SAM protein [Rikenellaceae bacterium]|jgi:wyosine [tRNA(Phe)-imidazoG37] synthetase (radical SAM superfamily)|nr:radical SAM protein [Rikenellaceae bacterium]